MIDVSKYIHGILGETDTLGGKAILTFFFVSRVNFNILLKKK